MEAAGDARESMATFQWLFVLTLAELVVVYALAARPVMLAALIGLAIAKLALVAAYFSEVRLGRKLLAAVALTPPGVLIAIVSTHPEMLLRVLIR